jgi:hypothetical protein
MHPKLDRPQRGIEGHVDWRAQCLRNAGFERSAAAAIARETAFDLHALLGLVDRGCPPALAMRILAPLEWEGPE